MTGRKTRTKAIEVDERKLRAKVRSDYLLHLRLYVLLQSFNLNQEGEWTLQSTADLRHIIFVCHSHLLQSL